MFYRKQFDFLTKSKLPNKMKFLSFLLFVVLLWSCGPSEEELARRDKEIADSTAAFDRAQKIIADSIASFEKIQEEKKKVHDEKVAIGLAQRRSKLENILQDINQGIEMTTSEYSKTNEFQWGRTVSEKEKQLGELRDRMTKLREMREGVQKEISMISFWKEFDFQETPEGTVNEVFRAANSGDYSKLRYLIDPYGEFDEDVFRIGMIDSSFPEDQDRFKSEFQTGRIIGESTINGDFAEVEFAYGSSSNRLETFKLVRRLNKWYISSL